MAEIKFLGNYLGHGTSFDGGVYGVDGVSPTMMSRDYKGAKSILDIQVLGNYMPSGHDASRVVDSNGIAPTVKEKHGTVTGIVDARKVDMRYGRNTIIEQSRAEQSRAEQSRAA